MTTSLTAAGTRFGSGPAGAAVDQADAAIGPAAAAITSAAVAIGLPDPVTLECRLTTVDIEGLLRWFDVAATVATGLSAGVDRLGRVLGRLAAGWSSPAPRDAVLRLWEAARQSQQIVEAQVDAAHTAAGILRQTRMQADGRVCAADAALRAHGWPRGDDLLIWATTHLQLPAVTAVLEQAVADLVALRNRNEGALLDLATVLRQDPRDPVQRLLPSAALAPTPTGSSAGVAGAPSPATARLQLQAVEQANADRLTADLHSPDLSTAMMALGVRGALDRVQQGGQDAHLVVYESADSGSQGRAAIAVGDLAAAANVAIVVPGIGNAPVGIADGVADATALLRESQRQAPGDVTAVVAWYGYDIPFSVIDGVPVAPPVAIGNAAAATDDGNATAGGAALLADLAAFRPLATANARWVAAGFSMGSTTVSAAAAQGGTFDDLILLGSPGAGHEVSTAQDYRAVTADHTYVTAFEQDPVTHAETDLIAALIGAAVRFPPRAAPFGPDPAGKSFGAQMVDVDSNAPDVDVRLGPGILGLDAAITNGALDLMSHHQQSNYLGGPSLQAVAAVVVGHYADVPIKPGR